MTRRKELLFSPSSSSWSTATTSSSGSPREACSRRESSATTLFEKDKIYAYQTLGDDELVVYDRIYGILAERIPRPDLVIYLQISLPTLLKRIVKDGSPMEKNISEKYLGDLVEAFDYFFFNYQATPLLVVKADELNLTREEEIADIVDKLAQIKKGPLFYVPQSYAQRDIAEEIDCWAGDMR